MSLINVILSGGVGSRLWPLSRKSRPKQYIPMFNGKSLFELCVERNKTICDKQVVVGNIENYQLSRDILAKAGVDKFDDIIEALPRNTAAAIAFAAFQSKPEDILLVTPSDHSILDIYEYEKSVNAAVALAAEGNLVTFGITPTKPETGFGYIEFKGNEVVSFKEKPLLQKAIEYCESRQFLWNSGMFCFKADSFLQELKKFELPLYNAALAAWQAGENGFLKAEDSLLIPSISIDYAVMERSDKIKVIEAAFGWSDLGSFDALWDFMDESENKRDRKHLVLGTKKHVEIIGIDNIIFVETDDAILVVQRQNSQDVKAVYEKLENEKPELLK